MRNASLLHYRLALLHAPIQGGTEWASGWLHLGFGPEDYSSQCFAACVSRGAIGGDSMLRMEIDPVVARDAPTGPGFAEAALGVATSLPARS